MEMRVEPMARYSCDIIVLSDFRQPLCSSSTIIEQLRAAASSGYQVGLVQLKSILIDHPAPLHEDIQAMVAEGLVTMLDPDLPASARLIIGTDPKLFTHLPKRVLQLEARTRLVLVREGPVDADGRTLYDWARIHRHAGDMLGGVVTFAPLHALVRRQLNELDPSPRLTVADWPDVLDPAPWRLSRDEPREPRPIIGRHGQAGEAAWPMDADRLLKAYPDDPEILVRLLGGGPVLKDIIRPFPRNWEVLPAGGIDAKRFLASLDFFVTAPHPAHLDPVDPAILEALASGVVTILPPSFEPIFGDAAVYAAPDQIQATVRTLYSDRAAYLDQSRRGVQAIAETFSPARMIDRLRMLIGSPEGNENAGPARSQRRPSTPTRRRRRVLFITINGVGMGHLTRMLAIARRCPEPIEPVFLTMSQALKVVREQGFLAEYVPSRTYLDCDLGRWNGFLRDEVNELIAFYDPAVVLFDGNVPYQGVIDAIKANPDPWYVWSRRGMWRAGDAGILSRENVFDAVLEPGDLADDYDDGMTTQYRSRTRRVKPIRLLDPGEMLPRGEARRELGLSAEKPAVLIQLGAGNNFDYRNIHKTAFSHVAEHHDADIAVGEWLISDKPMALPDGVIRLPGYPFARYFNAFDLAISAVGYNSFHELLYAGVPTILVPNEAMEQDNQLARALYADRHGLALCVRAKEIYSFTNKIDQLFDPAERKHMQQRLATIEQQNGAAEAAAFIEEMVYSRRVDRA
jgi:UDP:flavonoid glycosyltransferase YjiC (YdhE family)